MGSQMPRHATAQAKSWHPPAPVVQPWQVHRTGGAFVLLPVDPSRSRHSRPVAGKISTFKRKGSQLLEMTPVWNMIWRAYLHTFHYMPYTLHLYSLVPRSAQVEPFAPFKKHVENMRTYPSEASAVRLQSQPRPEPRSTANSPPPKASHVEHLGPCERPGWPVHG